MATPNDNTATNNIQIIYLRRISSALCPKPNTAIPTITHVAHAQRPASGVVDAPAGPADCVAADVAAVAAELALLLVAAVVVDTDSSISTNSFFIWM